MRYMQNTYAQNKEDLFVLNYFGGYTGRVLDIGANDGMTFSNSRLLIENGWQAVLVEPGTLAHDLYKLYHDNDQVIIHNFGIGSKDEVVRFWESGSHVPGGIDKGLVSTLDFEETKRWPDVEFVERFARIKPFSSLKKYGPFDFISIDAEGYDELILKQIDLKEAGCQVLCIEWNGDGDLLEKYKDYCHEYQLAVMNGENLIFVK